MEPVQLVFGDKTRTLKFDMAALRDLEAVMDGKPLRAILMDILNRGINATTCALWAGFKHEDKTLNLKLVSKMLDAFFDNGGDHQEIRDALDEALGRTGVFGREKPGNAQPEPATQS